jgi:hypothetical protein
VKNLHQGNLKRGEEKLRRGKKRKLRTKEKLKET